MTSFSYVALEPSGKKKTGVIDAADRDAAIAAVLADGKYVVEIKEQKAAAPAPTSIGRRKITRSDLALFTRRMADLAAAGLPLDRVLQVVAEQSESPQLAEISLQALEDVRGGLPVSQALAKFPKQFPPVYTETLKAGEASGQFPEVASRLADFQEKEVTRRSQITAALVYPGVLAFMALFVIVFMLTFVVPRLSGVFDDLGSDLPVTTQVLLASTSFLTKNYIAILIGIGAAVLLYRGWVATEAGSLARDRFLLRIPVVGKLLTKAVISRYARVLGTLLFGGVPILESLKLAGLAAGNKVFLKTSEGVVDDVRDGRPIHDAMRDTGAFPPVLTHMVAIGEETGDLPKMLGRVSDSLDFEVDNGMRRAVSLVEPLIVVFMGVFVAFVVLSVMLPIYEAQNAIK